MSESKYDDDKARIRTALQVLGEHFDTVQIFTTRHEEGELNGTVQIAMGAGNWYARYGQVIEWLGKNNERTRISTRREDADE